MRAEVTDQIRKDLPAITKGYQEGLRREAEKTVKKPAGKETMGEELREEAD